MKTKTNDENKTAEKGGQTGGGGVSDLTRSRKWKK